MVILAFTLPKAYELKKDEVDKFAAKAHHHGKVCANAILLYALLLQVVAWPAPIAYEVIRLLHAPASCAREAC